MEILDDLPPATPENLPALIERMERAEAAYKVRRAEPYADRFLGPDYTSRILARHIGTLHDVTAIGGILPLLERSHLYRLAAYEALSRMGPDAAPRLLAAASSATRHGSFRHDIASRLLAGVLVCGSPAPLPEDAHLAHIVQVLHQLLALHIQTEQEKSCALDRVSFTHLQPLLSVFETTDEKAKLAFLFLLEHLHDPASIPTLQAASSTAGPQCRGKALEILMALGHTDVLERAIQTILDGPRAEQIGALEAIQSFQDQQGRQLTLDRLRPHPDFWAALYRLSFTWNSARTFLVQAGSLGLDAILSALTTHTTEEELSHAKDLLVQFHHPEARAALVELCRDYPLEGQEPSWWYLLHRRLAGAGESAMLPLARRFWESDDEDQRIQGLFIGSKLMVEEIFPQILELFATEPRAASALIRPYLGVDKSWAAPEVVLQRRELARRQIFAHPDALDALLSICTDFIVARIVKGLGPAVIPAIERLNANPGFRAEAPRGRNLYLDSVVEDLS